MSTNHSRNGAPPARLAILQGVLPIRASRVPAELVAGLTLAALAVPEVMGYTKIAGTPVITGLYTILVPTALFALFGSSRHLVVGADSATAAILAAGLVGLAATGSDQYVALAGVLALMAAAFPLVARCVGLGFLADFLSRTVLVGFLTGVGIQVALGEISGMLGLKGGGHGTLQKVWGDLQQIEAVNLHAVTIAACVLAVIVGTRMISRRIPGALIAVTGAIAASWALDLGAHVHVLGTVPGESGTWHARPVESVAQALPGLAVYRFTHSMYYANSQQLADEVTRIATQAQPPLRWLCLDASAVDDVDYTAVETLRALEGVLEERGIRLVVAQLMEEVEAAGRAAPERLFGEARRFDSLADVVAAYREDPRPPDAS